MSTQLFSRKNAFLSKFICVLVAFILGVSLGITPVSYAQVQYISHLPQPGVAVPLSVSFDPPVLRGLKVDPANPLHFDFLVDSGQDHLDGNALKKEVEKLVKYYLTALTIPDEESWVNLSPYEGDRIIPDALAMTEMGKDMLEEDYLLKQVASSLTNPNSDLGQKFWQKVYKEVGEKYGTTDVPVKTFSKVWIVPDTAQITEENGVVYIGRTHLKVMLDQDYTSLKADLRKERSGKGISSREAEGINAVSSKVTREIVLPLLDKEVNEGRNFAQVRQMYHSAVLAIWFKDALKESLLGKVYVNKGKVGGIDIQEKDIKEKVYERYLKAYRRGAYNLIKEDFDLTSGKTLPRKYFAGGINYGSRVRGALRHVPPSSIASQGVPADRLSSSSVLLAEPSAAMLTQEQKAAFGQVVLLDTNNGERIEWEAKGYSVKVAETMKDVERFLFEHPDDIKNVVIPAMSKSGDITHFAKRFPWLRIFYITRNQSFLQRNNKRLSESKNIFTIVDNKKGSASPSRVAQAVTFVNNVPLQYKQEEQMLRDAVPDIPLEREGVVLAEDIKRLAHPYEGTILDPSHANSIFEKFSETEVRLKIRNGYFPDRPQEMAGENFNVIWAQLQRPRQRYLATLQQVLKAYMEKFRMGKVDPWAYVKLRRTLPDHLRQKTHAKIVDGVLAPVNMGF